MQNSPEPTGNLKTLLILVTLVLGVFGVLLFAATQPDKKQAANPPQVAGTAIEEEFVAPEDQTPANSPANDAQSTYYEVSTVSDGDTIKVNINGKIETVRLIGVDTPETRDPRKPVQCFGREASAFTTQQLLGKKVRLDPDTSQQERDKYGRLLRYVYLQNGTLFNQLLVASGYAYEYTYKTPYQFQTDFKAAQQEAQTNRVGLWSDTTCNGKK